MKVYIKKSVSANYELIETPDKELGKGGQARVYKISTRGYEEYCLKKFIRIDDAKRNYERIAYMIQHPPKNIMDSPNFRICWPVAFAYDASKNFIGYVMPLAFPNSRDLKILEVYNPNPISQQAKYKKYPDWFNKFELDTNEGLKNRMKMLCNWAVAIHMLHETHKYVIVDLKPENVMATSSGKISVVDTDSFQISEYNKILYPGAAFTPPYFPPEGKTLQRKGEPFTESCDRFAAAICFYKILVGLHPYSGTIKKYPYDKYTTEEEFIEQGLYAYGDKKQYLSFPSGFNLHQNYNNLSPALQRLFARAFGSNYGDRPSMEEWAKALRESATSSSNIVRSVVKPTKTNSLAVKITDVTFADADYDGNIKSDYGSKLRTDVEYLTPKLTYQVLRKGSPVTIGCKIFRPNGQVLTDGDAKSGYYYSVQLSCDTQSTHTIRMVGLGNKNKTLYDEAGTYQVEFYQDDKCLYKTSFEIHPKISSKVSSPSRSTSSSSSSSSSTHKPYTYTSTYKPSLNDRVADLGDWFADHSDDAASVVGIVAAVIWGLAVLVGTIALFVEVGLWAILGLGIAATIGYYGCIIALGAGAFISKILFGILRVVFYNLYVLLLFILIPTGIIVYNVIDDHRYTKPVVQTSMVPQTTTYYCTINSLNVRSAATTKSKAIGKLTYGQAVEVIERGESFSKIKFQHANGTTAWVGNKYLSLVKPAPKSSSKSTSTSTSSSSSSASKSTSSSTSSSSSSSAKKTSSSKATISGVHNQHEYVDLGLSVKWATCNVGATKAEGYGGYFAYGETTSKKNYTWETYKHGSGSSRLDKYNSVDGKDVLDAADDAATANWGGNWRMPTKAEVQELMTKCKWEWTTVNGTQGYKVISKTNGNYIFLPGCSYFSFSSRSDSGPYGNYMTSTLHDDNINVYKLGFNPQAKPVCNSYSRIFGYSVRPVLGDRKATTSAAKSSSTSSKTSTTAKTSTTSSTSSSSASSYSNATAVGSHAYVDMGLSVKWATCNVGATKPEDYGSYFAWGETITKDRYDRANYEWENKKYLKTILSASDDVAKMKWGGQWRMPTMAELEELLKNCKWDWVTRSGVQGYHVVSKINGNSIFLPAAGDRVGDSIYDRGEQVELWSSSRSKSGAYYMVKAINKNLLMDSEYTYFGRSVRPVHP